MDDPYLLPVSSALKFSLCTGSFYSGVKLNVSNSKKDSNSSVSETKDSSPVGKLRLFLDETTNSPRSSVNSDMLQTSLLTFFPDKSGKKTSPPKRKAIETPSTSKVRRKLPLETGEDQYLLDVGQKALAPQQCHVCQMYFSPIQPTDVVEHKKYHDRFVSVLKFPKKGWKSVPIVSEFPDGNVYQICQNSAKFAVKKVAEVCEVVDRDLGFPEDSEVWIDGRQAFLFVTSPYSGVESKVIGCCIAEPLNKADRMLSDGTCKQTRRKAVLGVNRIWVSPDYRGKKVATRLLDAVRFHFFVGYTVDTAELAFSDPTTLGLTLATHYCATQNILVYKPH